jgi:hypothetical protein
MLSWCGFHGAHREDLPLDFAFDIYITYRYIYSYSFIRTYIEIYTYIHIYTYIYIYIYIYRRIHIYIYIYKHTYTYNYLRNTYIHTCILTCIHTYIQHHISPVIVYSRYWRHDRVCVSNSFLQDTTDIFLIRLFMTLHQRLSLRW